MGRNQTCQKKSKILPILIDENVWTMFGILRVLDRGGRNVKQDPAKFTDTGAWSKDSGFEVLAQETESGSDSLLDH